MQRPQAAEEFGEALNTDGRQLAETGFHRTAGLTVQVGQTGAGLLLRLPPFRRV